MARDTAPVDPAWRATPTPPDGRRRAAACCTADGSPFGPATTTTSTSVPAAAVRASLGCGNPIAVAELRPGDTVLDLGSGGGLDVLLSARRVGPTGHVYGLDATVRDGRARPPQRQPKPTSPTSSSSTARSNTSRSTTPPSMSSSPTASSSSSTDKDAVFAEIARVLRPGGSIGISDIVRVTATDDGTGTRRRLRATRHHPRRLPSRASRAPASPRSRSSPPSPSAAACTTPSSKPPNHGSTSARWNPATGPPCEPSTSRNRHRQRHLRDQRPTWDDWDRTHLRDHRLVATDADGAVIGWAAASPVSDRCAYRGVAEDSLYVHPEHHGQGVGTALLERSSPPPSGPATGRSRPASSPRTLPASPSTSASGSASSDAANASANSTESGATPTSSNAAAIGTDRPSATWSPVQVEGPCSTNA